MAAKIRRNDTVEVIRGKDRGRRGEVRRVLPKANRVVVAGANMVKLHRRARSQTDVGGIIDIEAPLHLSNVKIVCPSCDEASRVGFRILEDGRKVRFCKKCDDSID